MGSLAGLDERVVANGASERAGRSRQNERGAFKRAGTVMKTGFGRVCGSGGNRCNALRTYVSRPPSVSHSVIQRVKLPCCLQWSCNNEAWRATGDVAHYKCHPKQGPMGRQLLSFRDTAVWYTHRRREGRECVPHPCHGCCVWGGKKMATSKIANFGLTNSFKVRARGATEATRPTCY